MTMFKKTSPLFFLLPIVQVASAQDACDASMLNTTVRTWPVTSIDTIFSIAASTSRGVCNIARANRMADANLMVAGETLLIPGESCAQDIDNTTCLVPNMTYYASCVPGGLHTYNARYNDTRASIALKFQVSLDTITTMGVNVSAQSADAVIAADTQIKIPQCSPSQCTVQPYKFTFGTYVDLANELNTTVGQIMAFNPTYNYSSKTDVDDSPIISLPMNCRNSTGNITVIS